jgi:hypothetical protein
VSVIYYLCCSIILCMPFIIIFIFRSAISCLGQLFYILSVIYLLSAILCCVSHFTYPMFRAVILSSVSYFHVVPVISCFASHFHVVSIILLFCQILYIYCQSFFGDIFFWLCVLQVY